MREGWRLLSVGDACEIVNGGTPKTDIAEYWGGRHLWITPAEMGKRASPYAAETARKLTDLGLADCSARLLPPLSVILSSRAPIGHLVINTEPMATNQGCKGLVPRKSLDHKFLFYYLMSIVDRLNDLGTGTTFKELSGGKLKEVRLPLPPIAEQKRIVAILDEAFEGIATAVANAEKNLANASELFESYLNAALSRADGWVERKIGDSDVLQIIDGDRGTNYPSKADFFEEGFCVFLNTKNVRPDGFNFDTTMFITKEKDSQLRKGKLKRRDVVLTTRGTIGNIALYDDNVSFDNVRINSGMLIFRPNEKIILSEYLFEMLRSGVVKSQIAQFVSGAAQPQLPIHTLSKFSIPVPKILADQKQIVGRLHALSSESKRLEGIYQQKREGLAELKHAILHKAFCGGLTAPAAKALVEAAE